MTDTERGESVLMNEEPSTPGDEPAPAGEESPPFRFSRTLTVLSDPGSVQAEEIGALRTHLLANHLRERRRSLLICAASPDVGCTYVTVSIGAALALAGVRTLIIDGNMRDPGLEHLIRPAKPVVGLRQCLEGDASLLGDAICNNVLPGLSLLYSGGIAQHPQELLSGARFKGLVTDCLRDFDLVLVDAPASNRCADPQIIATVLRYAMVVARRNVSFVGDVKLLVKQLESSGATVVGTFLNDV